MVARRAAGAAHGVAVERLTRWIDFAVDPAVFHMTAIPPSAARRRACCSCASWAARAGCALGVEALRQLAQARPDVQIAFFGATGRADRRPRSRSRTRRAGHGIGARDERRARAALLRVGEHLVAPLQGMACGCAVVDADVPGARDDADGQDLSARRA
jgi:hypothetical protein